MENINPSSISANPNIARGILINGIDGIAIKTAGIVDISGILINSFFPFGK
jgi:hypothetical protein